MNSLFDENLISFVREALELVQTAITYDEASNYVRACEYYDNTVLLLDEALNKLDPSGREYDTILQLRLKYATRLELLRAHETSKRDLNLLGGGTPITKIPGQGTSRQRRMSRQPFDEEMSPVPHHQEPSSSSISLIRQPYNVLRIVRSTIETGAFLPCQSNSVRNLHGRIYIPSIVWKQFGVKLSGLSAKTSAFESLVELIETRLENLCYPDGDLESLMVVKEQFQHFIAAIQALQNSLSKPFPFISEIDVTVPASVADSEKNGSGSSSGPGSGFIGSGSSSSGSGLGLGSSPPTSSAGKDGKGQGWGTFVAGYAKTVVKYAEVGYHRMGAMSARVSDDDFAAYATLILILCEKCQLLDRWHEYLEKEREHVLTNGVDSSHRNSTPISVNNPILVNRVSDGAPVSSSSSKLFGVVDDDDDTALATTTAAAISSSSNSITSSAADSLSDSAAVDAHNKIPKPIKAMAPRLTTRGRLNTIDLAPEQQQWLSVVEDMLIDMMSVSRFIREVICEIVLRDLEHLTARYMRKMRKSFSRMHWDDDGENPEQDMS